MSFQQACMILFYNIFLKDSFNSHLAIIQNYRAVYPTSQIRTVAHISICSSNVMLYTTHDKPKYLFTYNSTLEKIGLKNPKMYTFLYTSAANHITSFSRQSLFGIHPLRVIREKCSKFLFKDKGQGQNLRELVLQVLGIYFVLK